MTPCARFSAFIRTRATTLSRADLEVAGLQRRRQRHRDRVEHRADVAPVHAVAAVVAGRAGRCAARVSCASRRCVAPASPGSWQAAVKIVSAQLSAIGGRNGPSGNCGNPSLSSADADEALDAVVVRLHVRVVDGPVHAVAVERGGLELVVGHAIGGARPVQRAAAEAARTAPRDTSVSGAVV